MEGVIKKSAHFNVVKSANVSQLVGCEPRFELLWSEVKDL